MSTGTISVASHAGGWVVSTEEAPIGLITESRGVLTPSGGQYTVLFEPGQAVLMGSDNQALATLKDRTLKDEKTGVQWQLKESWRSAFDGSALDLDSVWAVPYSLEEAQGTVPNRVKLLLAWLVTRPGLI